jgi:hypothetical protein
MMKLSLPPKLVEKLVWVPLISFCNIFIPSYTFDAVAIKKNIVKEISEYLRIFHFLKLMFQN